MGRQILKQHVTFLFPRLSFAPFLLNSCSMPSSAEGQKMELWSIHNILSLLLLILMLMPCSSLRPSTGGNFLQGTFFCSGMKSSMGCNVDICSGIGLCGMQRDNLHHHGPHQRLQGDLWTLRWIKWSSWNFCVHQGRCWPFPTEATSVPHYWNPGTCTWYALVLQFL